MSEGACSRAYHFFEKMVDPHCCVRDEGGFTLHVQWLVAFHWVGVRVRVRVYNLKTMSTMLSEKRCMTAC